MDIVITLPKLGIILGITFIVGLSVGYRAGHYKLILSKLTLFFTTISSDIEHKPWEPIHKYGVYKYIVIKSLVFITLPYKTVHFDSYKYKTITDQECDEINAYLKTVSERLIMFKQQLNPISFLKGVKSDISDML